MKDGNASKFEIQERFIKEYEVSKFEKYFNTAILITNNNFIYFFYSQLYN